MSATISFKTPGFWRIPRHPSWKHSPVCRTPISLSIKQIGSRKPQLPSNPHPTDGPRSRNILFSKILSSDREGSCKHEKDFDCFTVREATLDEEYWTAAWLRAESHWEDQLVDRFIGSRKRKFAEQEFYALKRRCNGHTEKCTCIVANMRTRGKWIQNLHGCVFVALCTIILLRIDVFSIARPNM